MIRANSIVLFDIDGTLIRRAGPHHKTALIAGIRKVTGLETSLDGIATHGMLDGDLIRNMLQASGYTEDLLAPNLPAIITEAQRYYLDHCADDLRPYLCPGVVDTLRELRNRGAALGLVTGNLSQIGWKKMELARLRDYFSFGAFAEDNGTRINLARMAAKHAFEAGLADPDARVSLIGDHPNDIRAAKANNFQAIGVATGLSTFEELQAARPDMAVLDLRELDVRMLL